VGATLTWASGATALLESGTAKQKRYPPPARPQYRKKSKSQRPTAQSEALTQNQIPPWRDNFIINFPVRHVKKGSVNFMAESEFNEIWEKLDDAGKEELYEYVMALLSGDMEAVERMEAEVREAVTSY